MTTDANAAVGRGRHEPGHHHGRRSLDVVVEGGKRVPVGVEIVETRAVGEVLPLQQRGRKHLLNCVNELRDEALVLIASEPMLAIAHIERIGEQLGVLRANVERDGDRPRRMQAGPDGVERELADGDPHAAGALITDAEDAFVVGHDDDGPAGEAPGGQNLGHSSAVARRDVDSSRPAIDPRPVAARQRNRGCVDDGDGVREVFAQEPEEEGFVAIHEAVEVDVPPEVARLEQVLLVDSRQLLIDGRHPVGKQAVQAKGGSFFPGEGVSFVEERTLEQVEPADTDGEVSLACVGIGGSRMPHGPTHPNRSTFANAASSTHRP